MGDKCIACGQTNGGVLQRHHVKGRKVSKDTISLCPNCHYFTHAPKILVDNAASRAAKAELATYEFISAERYQDILDKYGYQPFFEGEQEWIEANT